MAQNKKKNKIKYKTYTTKYILKKRRKKLFAKIWKTRNGIDS